MEHYKTCAKFGWGENAFQYCSCGVEIVSLKAEIADLQIARTEAANRSENTLRELTDELQSARDAARAEDQLRRDELKQANARIETLSGETVSTCGGCRKLIRDACRCVDHERICEEQQRAENAERICEELKDAERNKRWFFNAWERSKQECRQLERENDGLKNATSDLMLVNSAMVERIRVLEVAGQQALSCMEYFLTDPNLAATNRGEHDGEALVTGRVMYELREALSTSPHAAAQPSPEP